MKVGDKHLRLVFTSYSIVKSEKEPCGKTAGNSGNDDAGERMERKIEEETEGRGGGKEYRLRQSFFNDNHFLTTIIFLTTTETTGTTVEKHYLCHEVTLQQRQLKLVSGC